MSDKELKDMEKLTDALACMIDDHLPDNMQLLLVIANDEGVAVRSTLSEKKMAFFCAQQLSRYDEEGKVFDFVKTFKMEPQ